MDSLIFQMLVNAKAFKLDILYTPFLFEHPLPPWAWCWAMFVPNKKEIFLTTGACTGSDFGFLCITTRSSRRYAKQIKFHQIQLFQKGCFSQPADCTHDRHCFPVSCLCMHKKEVPGYILTVLIKPRTVGALKEKGTVQELERAGFSDPLQWRGSMDPKVSAANQRRQVWTRLLPQINPRYRNLENTAGEKCQPCFSMFYLLDIIFASQYMVVWH